MCTSCTCHTQLFELGDEYVIHQIGWCCTRFIYDTSIHFDLGLICMQVISFVFTQTQPRTQLISPVNKPFIGRDQWVGACIYSPSMEEVKLTLTSLSSWPSRNTQTSNVVVSTGRKREEFWVKDTPTTRGGVRNIQYIPVYIHRSAHNTMSCTLNYCTLTIIVHNIDCCRRNGNDDQGVVSCHGNTESLRPLHQHIV